jgi:hypothetical protein
MSEHVAAGLLLCQLTHFYFSKVAFDDLFEEFLTCRILGKAGGREHYREPQGHLVIMEGPLRSASLRTGPALAKQTFLRQLRFHDPERG